MFSPGQRVGVAVSGGADSVCLLDALVELAPGLGVGLSVLHLDHGLRGEESREDARFVAALAARLGLPFHAGAVDVRALAATGNLEQAARAARYGFFRGFLESGQLDRIALGHTRSDQAETVLYRFLRGSGTAGLAGIRPVMAEGIVRPLIEIDRADVEAWLRARNIAWREDSTNASLAFDRNRIRHELLPALAREWNPAIAGTLANTADWAREEEAYWEIELAGLAAELLSIRPPAVLMRAASLNALRPAAARRLVRRAIELAKGDLRGIDFEHVRAILRLAASTEGSGRLQVAGLDAYRSFDWLRLAPPELAGPRNFEVALQVPGRTGLPDGAVLAAELLAEAAENTANTGMFDSVYNGDVGDLIWTRITRALEVRNWRPGDRYRPTGVGGEEKIKTLFQQARVPLWERRHWPVLTSGEEIVWVKRFGAAAAYAANAGSGPVLRIRYFAG